VSRSKRLCDTAPLNLSRGGPAPIVAKALKGIASVYAIENTIRGRSAGECRSAGKEQACGVIELAML
jgi:hypothetical protein